MNRLIVVCIIIVCVCSQYQHQYGRQSQGGNLLSLVSAAEMDNNAAEMAIQNSIFLEIFLF